MKNVRKNQLSLIIVILGALVLYSYKWGIDQLNGKTELLWGKMPIEVQNFFPPSILLATTGFFVFTYYILFRMENGIYNSIHIFRIFGIQFGYILMLVFSIVWMPLTIFFIKEPTDLSWLFIRLVLFGVALGSIIINLNLWNSLPERKSLFHWVVFISACIFFIHTFIFDAIIWPMYFK